MKNLFLSILTTAGVIGFIPTLKGVTHVCPGGGTCAQIVDSASANVDTFGTGANQFSIDFTTIGNVGNAADPLTGYGSVGYNYQIGTYSISQNQVDAATASGLQGVTARAWSGDQPAANISWYQAAAFVNWLDTSTGHQTAYNLTYSNGSYSMDLWHSWDDGYDPNNLYRNKNAVYVLPSEDEFYKAAYGKSDGSGYTIYATASNTPPTAVSSGTTNPDTALYNGDGNNGVPASVYAAGGLSSYGTMGQGGNVWAWIESPYNGQIRGGDWGSGTATLMSTYRDIGENFNRQDSHIGFRVAEITAATVPEPSTYALFGLGMAGILLAVRRQRLQG